MLEANMTGFLVNAVTGERFQISKPAVFIGRNQTCDLILKDLFVSREHAMLVRLGENFFIQDLDSANGTRLNNAPLKGNAQLSHGDEIIVGVHRLVFVVEEPDQIDTVPMRVSSDRNPVFGTNEAETQPFANSGNNVKPIKFIA